jgi:hypothetical protein
MTSACFVWSSPYTYAGFCAPGVLPRSKRPFANLRSDHGQQGSWQREEEAEAAERETETASQHQVRRPASATLTASSLSARERNCSFCLLSFSASRVGVTLGALDDDLLHFCRPYCRSHFATGNHPASTPRHEWCDHQRKRCGRSSSPRVGKRVVT